MWITAMQGKEEIEKPTTRSNVPCLKHKCMCCCVDTKMPVSKLDVNRILKIGHKFREFAVKTKYGWVLRNDSGRCVFLIESGCKIYAHRPEGCRLYPLIYDENLKRPTIDCLCEYGQDFRIGKEEVKQLRNLLRRLDIEEKMRKQTSRLR